MTSLLRVVIAEDHYLVREGTRRALEDVGGAEVVAAVGNAMELEDAVGTGPTGSATCSRSASATRSSCSPPSARLPREGPRSTRTWSRRW